MSFSFTETQDGLLYEEQGSNVGLRTSAAIAGAIALLSSLMFLEIVRQMGALDTPAKLGALLASVLGILAFWAFGAYCFKIAFFIPMQAVRFHRDSHHLIYVRRTPLKTRETHHDFSEITSVDIVSQLDEDRTETFTISVMLSNTQKIEMGIYQRRELAAVWRDKLLHLVKNPDSPSAYKRFILTQ